MESESTQGEWRDARITSIAYLVSAYQLEVMRHDLSPEKGFHAKEIAAWINEDLPELFRVSIDLGNVSVDEVNYVMKLLSLGGLWRRTGSSSALKIR